MSASTSSFVAGHYTCTFASHAAFGATEDGFNLEFDHAPEEIVSDELGAVVVDGIYRGYNLLIDFDVLKFPDTRDSGILLPWGTLDGQLDNIGKPISTFAQQLVLTPQSGINSHLETFTFPLVVPRPGSGNFKLNTKLRRTKIMLRALPYYDSDLSKYVLFYRTGAS